MEYTVMEQYWIWLSAVDGIGPRRFYHIMSLFEDARDVWENINDPRLKFLSPKALASLQAAKNERFFFSIFAKLETAGVRAITRVSEGYPRRLTTITDPPATLYVRGDCDLSPKRAFAIVGSRRCTRDGQRAALEFSEKLAREDVTVVSGLAAGIDAAAHQGAVNAESPTIAVLGSGPDVIYPPENQRLSENILYNGGAVISEYLPGTQPLSGHFPARNRIINGLADGLLIVEGNKKSGAMITVGYAQDEGKDVFAVPGSIYSPLSATPNQLIVDGAIPAISPYDILEHFRWASRPTEKSRMAPLPEMDEDERKIVGPLREQSLTMSELVSVTGFSSQKINSLLTILELRGIISKQPGGEYRAYK